MIQKDDYIEGYEHYGLEIRKIRGWVDSVNKDSEGEMYYNIQADDEWNGTRGTMIFSDLGEVVKLDNRPRIELGRR